MEDTPFQKQKAPAGMVYLVQRIAASPSTSMALNVQNGDSQIVSSHVRTNGDEAASVDPGSGGLRRPNNLPCVILLLVPVPGWRVQECVDENRQVLQAEQTGV